MQVPELRTYGIFYRANARGTTQMHVNRGEEKFRVLIRPRAKCRNTRASALCRSNR